MAKNHELSDKIVSVCHALGAATAPYAGAGVTQNLGHSYRLPLKN
jgi:hypothetical protein